ncbi:TlpA family protein disulfide reductase [Roseateles sp. BYS180W]|uniref:TlpA family protein disulfide reductase n=1 Tax=Roseateles rivi TaxID=3299028 RepID=A0ABW7FUS2_9BURK
MKLSPWMMRAAAVAALLLAAGGLYWSLNERPQAPAVTYTLLDGSRHSSADWAGKVVLVNFWATSCSSCVAEMPELKATYQRFKTRGFDTVAVAMSYDPPAYVSQFAQSRQLPFGVAIDNTGEVAKSFGKVQLTPTTFVIDKKGRIVSRYVGPPDFAALHQQIERLLSEG